MRLFCVCFWVTSEDNSHEKQVLQVQTIDQKLFITDLMDLAKLNPLFHLPVYLTCLKTRCNILYLQQPDLSEIPDLPKKVKKNLIGYYKIARHYKWALGQVFDEMKYEVAIIMEG